MHSQLRMASLSLAIILAAAPALAQDGTWTRRAPLLEANSEYSVAEADGSIYVIGGYPASRATQATVQVYDVAADRWAYGPDLPVPVNHSMAASVDGRIYLVGGQTEASGTPYVSNVWMLVPAAGTWVPRAPMPTARSAGVAVVFDGRIYVAGGRPPRGGDFAVYDPAADSWTELPDLPSQRNHIAGAAIDGKVYIAGGRLEGGFQSAATAAVEVFDPVAGTWSAATPLPRARSGMNSVMAFGCWHVWGGEGAGGMFPDHTVYDPRTATWTRLMDLPTPVHGVTGAAFVDGLIFVPGGGIAVGGSSGSVINQVYAPAVRCD